MHRSLGSLGQTLRSWGLAILGIALSGCGGAQRAERTTSPPPPLLEPGRFSVVVAAFDGDEDRNRNGVGDAVERVMLDLQEFTKPSKAAHQGRGLQLVRLDKSQTSAEWFDKDVHRGHENARQWLRQTNANMLIRGKVTSVGGEHRLTLHVTSIDDHHGGRYTLPETTLPVVPEAELQPVLALVVGTEYGAYEVRHDRYIAWTLKPYLFKVEALSTKEDFLARWPKKADLFWVLGFAQWGTGEQMGNRAIIERALDSFERAENEFASSNEVIRARLRLNRASVCDRFSTRCHAKRRHCNGLRRGAPWVLHWPGAASGNAGRND
ncbi:MAG: hypothetical protein IPM54_41040 [Polyangiaceae bacterium]|nr:hypothetical protein [Polyangiaceae bacterium]